MPESSADMQGNFFGPHPLAVRLLEELPPGASVLEIGPGSGRNTRALQAAGADVTAIPAQREALDALAGRRFGAVLSTHALLHGTPPAIEALLRHAAACMDLQAKLYATFGSVRDARFGTGRKISAHTFASEDGDEAGIAHSYFTGPQVTELLKPLAVLELREVTVDDIAGRWSHVTAPLSGAWHWFAVAQL